MRVLALAILLFVLTFSVASALPERPRAHVLAVGHVEYVPVGGTGSGRECLPGDIGAELFIERGYSGDEEWFYFGTGTGVLALTGCGLGFHVFSGGQCFECNGSCRVLLNGTAECWYGWGGEADAPDGNYAGGYYMRLDPDGSFLYWKNYGIPWSPDYQLVGKLNRIA